MILLLFEAMEQRVQDKEFDFVLSGDSTSTAKQLENDLKRRDFRCNYLKCIPGQPWLPQVHEAVKTARWTLLCLDGKDMDCEFVHSLNAGLMESVRCQTCPHVLLVVTRDFEENLRNIEWTKLKLFPHIPRIVIDFNNANYLNGILDFCTKMLDVEIPGCLAHGLVFSQFNGFWRHILPELPEKIEQSPIYGKNPKITSTKLYVLLPIPRDFTMPCLKDESTSATGVTIKKTDENLTWETNHAGKIRKYILTFYEVTRDNQKFYCVVDIPNVLKTIYMLGEKQVNGVNVASEIFQFFLATNILLNHSQSFPDTVNIQFYNDLNNGVEDILFHAICNDLSPCDSSKLQNIQPLDQLSRSTSAQHYDFDVIVMRDDDVLQDEVEAINLETFLTQEKMKVWSFGSYLNGLDTSEWHIFVISKETNERIYQFNCVSLSGDEVRTIILLRDINPIDLPPNLKFAFVFSMKEPDFMQKLVQAMNREPEKLEHSLPTGDVATGLAWEYGVNYLNFTLGGHTKSSQEFTNRVKKFVEKKPDIGEGCINKFYSLCPFSCTTTGSIEQEDLKGSIKSMGFLGEYQTDVDAAISRPYKLYVYQYTNKETNRKRCFVCEYNTPFNCLEEMANKYKFAGVSKDNMYQQCELFVKRIPEILSCTDVKKKFGDYSQLVELIYFDDSKDTLLDVMREKLWEEGLPIIQSDEILYRNNTTV